MRRAMVSARGSAGRTEMSANVSRKRASRSASRAAFTLASTSRSSQARSSGSFSIGGGDPG